MFQPKYDDDDDDVDDYNDQQSEGVDENENPGSETPNDLLPMVDQQSGQGVVKQNNGVSVALDSTMPRQEGAEASRFETSMISVLNAKSEKE